MSPTEFWGEPERHRLVRLCATLSGDRDAAEDLAQETLLEAWRNVHKLHDPEGAERWLAAIARNVCRRWARRRGRDVAILARLDADSAAAGRLDLEVDLERAELTELLDRALGLLPPQTREVLVHRYVYESPHAEIGARMGLSEDAVSMRLARGKAAVRRLLGSQLRDEALSFGLPDASDGGWKETSIWCADCGRHKLLLRTEPPQGPVSFRCPGCNPDSPGAEYRLSNPFFARLIGNVIRPRAICTRAAEWSRRYFGAGAEGRRVACTRCGRAVALRRYYEERDGRRCDGLFAACAACGEQVSSSVGGLALTLAEVRRFRRDHPRTRAIPVRQVEAEGRPAIVVGYQDFLGSAAVHIVFSGDTLRVLEVHGAPA